MNLANLAWYGWLLFGVSLCLFFDDVVTALAYVHGKRQTSPTFGAPVAGLLAVLYMVTQ